jgi:ABC-type amino acid transport system permease subunit
VNYTFQFGVVWRDFGALMQGALLTFELGVLAFWGGALIGLAFAALKTFGGRIAARLVDAYVVFVTNTGWEILSVWHTPWAVIHPRRFGWWSVC